MENSEEAVASSTSMVVTPLSLASFLANRFL